MICEQVLPRRKSAFLGFSMALGAFLSSARLERALRGFLHDAVRDDWGEREIGHLHLSQHREVVVLGM